MHLATHYERIIGEWCDTTGVPRWQTDEDMNLSVDDSDIGLFHRSKDDQEVLHVFIDLGFVSQPRLPEHLLQLNSDLGMDDFGRYALHPEYGNVLYRVAIPLDDRVHGDILPSLIARVRDAARFRVMT